MMDDGVDFSLTAFSTLGGIPVKPFVEGQVVELATEAPAATSLEE
jgi:hypothetical protein